MTRLQDDFYEYVNGKWAETAVIPDDKPSTGGFMDLDRDIENLMLDITGKWQRGEELPEDSILQNFVKYHKMVADFDAREAAGVAPAMPLINEIKALSSFEDYTSKLGTYELAGKPNLLPFSVSPDFKNAQMNVLWGEAPALILPDTTYYEEGNEKGPELLAIWRQMMEKLLSKFDFSEEEIKDILDKVIAGDAELAKYVLSNEEKSEYNKLYHPYEWADFKALVPELPLDAFFTEVIGQTPDKIIVPEERYWKEFAPTFYSAANWETLHAALEKAALSIAEVPYSQALGLWYAGEKFSPEAKADVEHKVATMIEVYKDRLEKADWLASETREKAIVKLNVITPHIGYPEKLPETYAKKVIDESKTLVENAQTLYEISIAHSWSKWNQPVDRSEWHMPANMVAVIAHEISHAFDTNGASFDENGSLKDWWKPEDYEAFTARTQKVIDQFEGQDSYGAKINGKLTVSENVADLGGIAAALEAAKKEEDFSAEEFFTNFARIWRMKARTEYMQLLASVDVHAPGKLRTNVQLPNFDEFHKEFDVKEGDGMWRAPEDRVIIW